MTWRELGNIEVGRCHAPVSARKLACFIRMPLGHPVIDDGLEEHLSLRDHGAGDKNNVLLVAQKWCEAFLS